ncbi:unnamed protein product [Lactuca virosa]|uniref:DNA methyltransferase 1-associated 1 domain-containing protein n=1 Tax=Lactuca virosa TaxID=75947 RepID=A0AAU9LGF9_9ASTR|nr:unnamed protein product [Lactuca virosa]
MKTVSHPRRKPRFFLSSLSILKPPPLHFSTSALQLCISSAILLQLRIFVACSYRIQEFLWFRLLSEVQGGVIVLDSLLIDLKLNPKNSIHTSNFSVSLFFHSNRALMIARAPTLADVSCHPLVKEPYNISQEIERKRALSMVLSQTKHQERKDAEVLSEAKKITDSRMAAKAAQDAELGVTSNISPEGVEKNGAPADTVSPSSMQVAASGGGGVAPLMSMADNVAAAAASLRMLPVYLRTYALDQMVQAASSSVGLRTIKRVEQFLQELKVNLKPKVPTKAVCAEHLELRKEILTLLNLQKLCYHCTILGSLMGLKSQVCWERVVSFVKYDVFSVSSSTSSFSIKASLGNLRISDDIHMYTQMMQETGGQQSMVDGSE